MQSNDARMLLQCAVPTTLAGVVAAIVSGVTAGGPGVAGALLGAVTVVLFMGLGLCALQWIARAFPHLFQSMGLLLYTVQLLLLVVVLALLKDGTWLDGQVFALTVVVSAIVWIAFQSWSTLKSKALYVEVDDTNGTPEKQTSAGSASP